MNVIFLMHSCFLVELENSYLLFDCFDGERQEFYRTPIHLPKLKREKHLYVFCSHSHADHYDLSLLDLKDVCVRVSFIFSKDIKMSPNYMRRHGYNPVLKDEISFVRAGEEYTIADIKVKTLASTDQGVAFVVECEGKQIYHAGDLNWWTWPQDNAKERKQMERDYKAYLKPVEGALFDLAFVPFDFRIGEASTWGMRYFLEIAGTKHLFPMHFWRRYEVLKDMKQKYDFKWSDAVVHEITKENESFVL